MSTCDVKGFFRAAFESCWSNDLLVARDAPEEAPINTLLRVVNGRPARPVIRTMKSSAGRGKVDP